MLAKETSEELAEIFEAGGVTPSRMEEERLDDDLDMPVKRVPPVSKPAGRRGKMTSDSSTTPAAPLAVPGRRESQRPAPQNKKGPKENVVPQNKKAQPQSPKKQPNPPARPAPSRNKQKRKQPSVPPETPPPAISEAPVGPAGIEKGGKADKQRPKKKQRVEEAVTDRKDKGKQKEEAPAPAPAPAIIHPPAEPRLQKMEVTDFTERLTYRTPIFQPAVPSSTEYVRTQYLELAQERRMSGHFVVQHRIRQDLEKEGFCPHAFDDEYNGGFGGRIMDVVSHVVI